MSDEITGAIAGVWDNVLAQLTGSGATREEIADMALDCAHVITDRTYTAMFPQGFTPGGVEQAYAAPLAAASVDLAGIRLERARSREAVTDVPDVTGSGEGS